MDFTPLDGYLLDGNPGKAEAIRHLLDDRIDDPRAAPFYRAFEAIGARAADEAILALRAVGAGKDPEDAIVRRLRDLVATARAGKRGEPAVEAAREAYARELA
jgi:hypothetical protein